MDVSNHFVSSVAVQRKKNAYYYIWYVYLLIFDGDGLRFPSRLPLSKINWRIVSFCCMIDVGLIPGTNCAHPMWLSTDPRFVSRSETYCDMARFAYSGKYSILAKVSLLRMSYSHKKKLPAIGSPKSYFSANFFIDVYGRPSSCLRNHKFNVNNSLITFV